MSLLFKKDGAFHLSPIDPEERRRSWLSAYEADRWTVSDTEGQGKSVAIDFDVLMPDGRSLLDHADLCRTAKELTFWLRAGVYTRIDDAARHRQYGQAIIKVCYALVARGFSSFAELRSTDVDQMCEDVAFGTDGLTLLSKRIKEGLAQYDNWDAVPSNLKWKGAFDARTINYFFRVPKNWNRTEVNSEIEVANARLNGETMLSVVDVREDPMTIQNIQVFTTVFDASYNLRHVIEAQTLRFRPFPEGPAQRATALGRESTRTPIPPPELTLRLLEQSTRHLINHGKGILDRHRSAMQPNSSVRKNHKKNETLRSDIYGLSVACYILIAAFTARRAEEIKTLDRDCLHGNDEDGWWLKPYIEKTERGRSWIPIPSIVARAVETLRDLRSDDGQPGNVLLFEYLDPVSKKLATLRPETMLNLFAGNIAARDYVSADKEVRQWDWQTRQFRRFFAVLFFYRYKGQIETLAHHLRHFNLEMTNDYVTLEPDVAKIWAEEVSNFRVDIAKGIVSGRATYSGPAGERLTKYANRVMRVLEKQVTVISETASKALLRYIKRHQMVITPKPWVNCTCPRTEQAAAKAACRKIAGYDANAVGPDFSNAAPTVCPGCPHALIGKEHQQFIDEHLKAMSANVHQSEEPTIFAELQAANVVTLTGFKKTLEVA